MKLHVHTFTWICGLVGCQPSSVAINFLDHVTKWAPHVQEKLTGAAVQGARAPRSQRHKVESAG